MAPTLPHNPPTPTEDQSWSHWSYYVLPTLQDLLDTQEKLLEEVKALEIEVGKLQVKSSILATFFGILGGLIPILLKILKIV